MKNMKKLATATLLSVFVIGGLALPASAGIVTLFQDGGDRHHRHSGGHAASRPESGPGEGAGHLLHLQPEADHAERAHVRGRQQ